MKISFITILIYLFSTYSALGATWKAGKTDVTLGGYVKLDWMHVEGGGSSQSLHREITVPAYITNDGVGGRNGFQAIQSRFAFATKTDDISTFMDLDFYLSPGGNEIASNSYNPRLRNAYFKTSNWVFGQTWTNFMILNSMMEQVEFGGFTGQAFVRQALMKYYRSFGSFLMELSIENAESTLGNGDGGSGSAGSDQDSMPDFIGKLTHKGDYGAVSFAMMYRTHTAQDVTDSDDTGIAYHFGGNYTYFGKNHFRFAVAGGNLGRYGSFTVFKDAVFVTGNKIKATEGFQWHIGHQFHFTPALRTNIDYGVGESDTFTASQIKKSEMLHLSLIHQTKNSVEYGIEWSTANVVRFGSTKASALADKVHSNRYAFSARYKF